MPTQDTRQGGLLGGFMDRLRRQGRGIANATPGTRNFDWRQGIDAAANLFGIPGDLYASQNAPGDRWFWQRMGNNARGFLGSQPGAPLPGDPSMALPNYGQPGQQAPVGMGPLPNYNPDQTHAGPPAPLQNPQHLYGAGRGVFPATNTAGRQGTAGRFGTTIAQGPAAVNMARGFAPTGLGSGGGGGASSFGRDQLMRRWREA